jgi:hypothetical protein
LDGIELGLTNDYPIEKIPPELVCGVHLRFFPMWLEFWREDTQALKGLFESPAQIEAYYGGLTKDVLVADYRYQYERAKQLGAKYMVFHVSHARPEDSFTWQFDYTDQEVMEATLELVHQAFPLEDKDGPTLLFENLWWPGLNYADLELTKWFIEAVKYPNKGYLVDISHLTLLDLSIGRSKDVYRHLKKIVEALGDTKKWIQGVHLNQTLPKYYPQKNFALALQKYQKATDMLSKSRILKNHIKKLDPHLPFADRTAKDILNLLDIAYCVYETAPETIYEWAYFIKQQQQALR